MAFAYVVDRQRATDAVQLVLAPLLILGAAKIRQHVGEAPARIAELAPVIEIFRLPADVQESIDRRRAAQHLAARLDDLTTVKLRLGLGVVEPIVPRVGQQLGEPDRYMDPEIAILAAGFEEQHAMLAARGQAVCQNAPGTARADDDVIERTFHALLPLSGDLEVAWLSSGSFSFPWYPAGAVEAPSRHLLRFPRRSDLDG